MKDERMKRERVKEELHKCVFLNWLNTVTSRSYINYNLWFKNPIIKEAINDKIYTQFLDYLLRIWFSLSLVSVISCADMIRDHDYLQFQWSLIMISSVSGIPDHGGNPWSCLSSVSLLSSVDMILSLISIITDHDYL
jgi:hypothetical protein